MKFKILFLFLLASVCGWGQVTIFSENMGTNATGNPSPGTYTGFQNYGTLTFSGTGDLRNTSNSSGYTGASGGNNVMLNSNSETLIIDDIKATSYSNLVLTFGVRKGTNAENGTGLVIEYSIDGISGVFTSITKPSLPTGQNGWYQRSSTSVIPNNVTTIRFRSTNSVEWRIDDVILTGTALQTGNIVTFDPNGGTGTMADQTEDEPTDLNPNTFTRTGYSFDHWNTASDNSGTSYADEEEYEFDADMTLYAQWSINQYSVSYDLNGGSGTVPTTQTGDYNSNLTLADETGFSQVGFVFTGWNTAANGSGTAYASGGSFTIPASNTLLYAQWQSTLPSITTTGTITAMTAEYGNVSTNRNFSFTGINLSGSQITVTPPAGFEIATTSGGPYSTSLNYTISGGSSNGTVYIRLASITDVGTYSGNVNLSDGTTTTTISVPNSTVTPKALTVTGLTVNNKVYDGNATANLGGTPILNGIVNSDVVNLSGTYSATFNNKNVGNNKAVTVSGYTLSGADAGNYTLTQPTGLQGNITAKNLTVTGAVAQNKPYDGNTTATITGAILQGVISPDVVTVSGGGTFASPNVGTGISVTANLTLGGAGAGNYTLTQPTGLSADITKANPVFTTSTINLTVSGTYTLPGANISSTSNGGFTYSITGGGHAIYDGVTTLTAVSVGTETLTVNQAATPNFNAGSTTVTVNVTAYVDGAFYSVPGNVNWNNDNSWRKVVNGILEAPGANSYPNSGTVVVFITEGSTVSSNGSRSARKMTIENGGKFISTSGPGTVSEVLLIKTGGTFDMSNLYTFSGVFEIEDGGTFNYMYNNTNSRSSSLWAGTEKFHPNSNFVIKSSQNSSGFLIIQDKDDVSEYLGACFGNLIIDQSAGKMQLLPIGFNKTLTNSDLIFRNATDNIPFLNSTYTTTINGNLIIENTFSGRKVNLYNGTSGTGSLTVKGNIIHSGNDNLNLNNQNGGSFILNLEGDLTISSTGKLVSTSTNISTFNFSGTGDGSAPETTQNISVLNNSTASNIAFNVNSGAYANLDANFNLGTASTVTVNGTFDADDKVLSGISGSQTVTVNGTGIFKTTHANGFAASVPTNVETIDLQTNSTVEYYANGNQTVSNQLLGTDPDKYNYQNLEITGTGIKTGATVAGGATTGNIIVNQITKVNAGAKLHIAESDDIIIPNELPNVLTAKGGINVDSDNGAELVLHNNANLMQDAGVTNLGKITQLRNATVSSNQYNYWSLPVQGQNVYSIYNNIPANRVMTYNTLNDLFTIQTNPTTASFGIGYSVKGPSTNAPSNGEGNKDVTATFIGTPNNEASGMNTIAVETFTTDGDANNFNLIGNPFPSNLDLVKMYDENNIDGTGNAVKFVEPTAYFWDNIGNTEMYQQGSGYNQTNYAYVNLASGQGTAAPCTYCDGQTSGKVPNGIVKPGQGFIVNIEQNKTFLRVNNDMRTKEHLRGTEQTVYFKNGNNPNDNAVKRKDQFWLELVNPNSLHIQTAIGYYENAQDTYEIYDSKILSESVSDNIYTMSKDAVKLTIQGREGNFKNTDVIPLGVKFFVNGKYKIQLEETKGIFVSHLAVYLKDKVLDRIHNLSADGPYEIDGVAGEYNDRFEIVFKDGSTPSGPVLSTATQNKINILKRDNQIEISSSQDKITEVEIFDLSGWPVYKNHQVNSQMLRIPALSFNNQIIVVKVQTETGEIQTKKFVNQ